MAAPNRFVGSIRHFGLRIYVSPSAERNPGGDLPLKPSVAGGKRCESDRKPYGVTAILRKAESGSQDLVVPGAIDGGTDPLDDPARSQSDETSEEEILSGGLQLIITEVLPAPEHADEDRIDDDEHQSGADRGGARGVHDDSRDRSGMIALQAGALAESDRDAFHHRPGDGNAQPIVDLQPLFIFKEQKVVLLEDRFHLFHADSADGDLFLFIGKRHLHLAFTGFCSDIETEDNGIQQETSRAGKEC